MLTCARAVVIAQLGAGNLNAQVLQDVSFEHLLCRETPIQGVIGVKMEKKTQSSYLHLYPKRLPCKIFTTVLKMHV